MSLKFHTVETDERGVATVTLNRPNVHNAFNDEFITELTASFESLSVDPKVRLVVLTGAGKSFCAGADLNWMKSMVDYDDQQNFEDSQRLAKLFDRINNCRKPVIGKIQGAALGGGTGLIAACDYAIACKSAKFGFTEVRLGLVPAVISPYVIAKIGESKARAYFLSGEVFEGNKAYEIGLVHQIVPLDDLDTATGRLVNRFLQAAPKAAEEAKDLIKNVIELSSSNSFEKLTEYTCKTISRIRIGDEGQEGMNALLEKRNPEWK